MPDQTFSFSVPAGTQILPAPLGPVPSDSVLHNFKGICPSLVQPIGDCSGTLAGALDAIEAAICSLQAGGGGGGGGGVTLNCGTLSPLLTAGNCVPIGTGAPAFIAGYTAAGAPLRYYPYVAPTTPFVANCANFLTRIDNVTNGGCIPTGTGGAVQFTIGWANGSLGWYPMPTPTTPFIADCVGLIAKLKASANGGCLPEDAVAATKTIAIDTAGNPIIRPIVTPSSLIDCVDLRSKIGSCFTLQGTTLSTVLGRDASGLVGFYPAPTGGGGGATSSVTPADTSSIDMSVSQVGSIFTVSAVAIVSPTAGNQLQSTGTGLFVPAPASSPIACADLNAKLRSTANGGCIGTSASAQSVYLGFDASGSPTIAPAPVAATPFIANCTDLLTRLTSCPPTGSVATPLYLGFDGAGNAIKSPPPSIGCADLLAKLANTTAGGCVTQDGAVPTLVYSWDAASGVRLRSLPAGSTPFITDCAGLLNRLNSCVPSTATSQTTYLAYDGTGNPVKAPLPAIAAQFVANCGDFNTRLRTTADSGCVPQQSGTPNQVLGTVGGVYGWYPSATTTPFVANCADFNNKLSTCVTSVATAQATYLGYDSAGNPVKAPLPAAPAQFIPNCANFLTRLDNSANGTGGCVPSGTGGTVQFVIGWAGGSTGWYAMPTSFIADCAGLISRLKSTANGGCLPEVATQQPKNLAIDATGSPVIAPSPVTPATRWLLNAPAVATTLAVTGGGTVTASFADTETTKNPAGATATATTVTVARSDYYDLSASVLARLSSATAIPAGSAISLFAQIVVVRGGVTTTYRIGQQPIMLPSIPAVALSTGIDYLFSGDVDSIWLPAGSTVQVQIVSANIANAGAYTYSLIQPIGAGQRLSITERTSNTAAI